MSTLPARLCVGLAAGLGVSFCGYFLLVATAGPASGAEVYLDVGVLLGLGALFFLLPVFRKSPGPPAPGDVRDPVTWQTWTLAGVFLLLVGLGVWAFGRQAALQPHGAYDAWATWNMRARFLFLGGDEWPRAFAATAPRGQGSYPPLLSMLVARSWRYLDGDAAIAPMSLAFLFTFGTVALTCSSLCVLRGTTQGLIGGAVLLATPLLITQGAWQYADVPLGFFILATVVLIAFHRRAPKAGYGLMVLAGLMCGCAVCTKNEGMSFLLWLVVIGVADVVLRKDRGRGLRASAAFAAGAALPLLLFAWFRTVLADGESHLTGLVTAEVLERLCDPARYLKVAKEFLRMLTGFREWAAFPLVLPFYMLLAGTRHDRRDRSTVRAAAALLLLMLLTYAAVCLVTPVDLDFLVHSSPERLLLHLWPTAVFIFFLAVRTPREAVAAAETER